MIRSTKFLFLISFFTLAIVGLRMNTQFVGNQMIGEVEAAEAEKVTDVVCGMEINKEGAKVSVIDGKNFYFCSDQCKTQFEGNPGKFTCVCFAGLKDGDEPCDCPHCSGEGVKCKCAEHGGHQDMEHKGKHGAHNEHESMNMNMSKSKCGC